MKTIGAKTYVLLTLFLFCTLSGKAQSISGVINDYTPVVAINPCDIEVADASAFAPGDKVMIIQMKGADINTTNTAAFGQVTAYNDAGNYEWNRIDAIAGTTITLDFQLVNTYDVASLVQLVRIPEYTNASIDGELNCLPWNGSVGGVLAFIDYGTTTFNADINVDYDGFQGTLVATVGWVNCLATYIEDDATIEAVKGESITILPLTMTKGLGAPANGGGGSKTDNGGGGGANFGAGGLGGNLGWTPTCNIEAQGGWPCTYSNALNKVFLGGAGGDAQDSEGPGICFGESGAGMVMIQTTEIVGNGFTISALGENAVDTPQDGGGGGGAGGTVLLDCPLYTTGLNVNTSGGDGGDAITYPWVLCSGGGGGGGGALWVSTPTVDAAITYVANGGVGGLSASTVDGSPGAPGGSITDLIIPEGTLPLLTIDAGNDTSVCDGDIITLTADNPDGAALAWTGGVTDGVPFAPPLGVTWYYVTGTLGACVATDSVEITVNIIPTIDAGVDQLVCEGELVTLTAFNPDGAVIGWSGGITDGVAFPALAGVTTYTVTATLAGCTNTDDVDIDGSGAVVVGAGPDLVVCDGDLVTLTATNPSGAVLGWTGGVTDGVAFAPPVGTTTYTVTGTLGPCNGTDDVDITVNPLDDATFTYPAGFTHCVSGPNPTASVTGTPGGTFTYVPTAGGPTLDIDPITGDITLATSSTGTYDITYTTAGPCPDALTLSLVVTLAPAADFFIDDFCANDLDPLPTLVGAGSAGVFTSGPGLVIDPTTGEVDLDASTPGTYTVTNTVNVPGCAIAVFNDDITIFDVPTATVSGGTIICPGDPSPDLPVNVVGGTGPYTIDYTLDGGVQPPLVLPGAAGLITGTTDGTYALTSITDANGCTAVLTSNTMIDLEPLPIIDPISDIELCDLDNGTVPAFTSDLGGTFEWENITGTNVGFGTGINSGNIGAFTGIGSPAADVTVTIEVTPTSPAGCVGAPTTFDVTIHPLPVPDIMPGSSGCAPHQVDLTDVGALPGSTCLWEFGDGSTGTSCGSASHTYTEDGLYDVTLTVTTAFGCVGTDTENGLIEVTPVPEAYFHWGPQVLTVENTEVEFTNASIDADVYEWDFGDETPLNSEVDPTHTFPETPGQYTVTLTALNATGTCWDTYSQLIIIDDVIIFYVPNVFTPDGDEYNETFKPVFYSGYDPYDYHLTIFNRWGEIMFESYNAQNGWSGTYGNRGLVQDGTYVWQIEFKETMSDKRHKHRGHVTILK